MSTLTNVLAALRFRLGNKKGFEADFLREIQFAQKRLEEDPTVRYWFLLNFASIVLNVGDNNIPFPAGFLREYDDVLPTITVDGVEAELERLDLEEARERFGNAVGVPQAYVMVDSLLQVYPKPDSPYIVKFPYMKREAALGGEVESNAWTVEAEQVLMNKAGIALSQGFRDKEALANFTNDYQVAFAELMTRVVQREESNMIRQRR